MIQIPHQQILDRYDTIPESLKDAGLSPYNTLLIKKIGEANHLTGEKISIILQLVGYVLFGFIHPEDLATEIKTELNIAPEIANAIASEIDRKIFTPIRTDLETVYAPPVAEGVLTAKPAPEEVLDLRPRAKETKPAEEAMFPTVETPIAGLGAPTAEVGPPVVSPPEAPKILPQEEKPEAVKPPEVSPAVAPSAPVLPTAEPGPVAAREAEPFIIHKEAEFKPLSETKKSLGGLFGFLRRGGEEKLQKVESVKAEVKIGDKSLKTEPPKITKTEPPKVRVVHYTEFQPAVSPFPTEAEKTKEEIKIEAKPPENLPLVSRVEPPPPVVNKVEPPIETKPSIPEKIPAGPIPVAAGAEPLDLRRAPVEAKPAPETKPVSEKKEEEEMIDLSTFKKI